MTNPLRSILKEFQAAFATPKGVSILDSLANALVEFSGNGFEPSACTLPAFRAKQEPTAKLPETKKKPVEVRDDGLLTDEEMKDWRYYGYGEQASERIEKMKTETRKSKAVEVDFDETPSEMHGITEREYGEMKAYNPPLSNLELAGAIKRMKPTKTLKEIAQILNETEQMVRHYSSALGKANPSPRKK